ncbi:hypothetical protein [Nonomuraea dietziae]|uniref:hypothetical protein n=1 Tax=Nonomuraea dietziae TaxID=65515 RepID=UPI0033DEEF49
MAISVPNPPYPRQRDYDRERLSLTGAEGISRAAVDYQRFGYLPFPLLVALLGGAVVLASVRRRPDALLPGLAAAALVLAPPFLTEFDVRYVVPAIPLTCMAAGLAAVGRTRAQDCRGPSVGSST